MITFDARSIYERLLQKIQQDPNWRAISQNSVISAILNSNSEIDAEIARYAEYLFNESKWDTAQNESSILAMANMLGYKPARKISASGKLIISVDENIATIDSSAGYLKGTEEAKKKLRKDFPNWKVSSNAIEINSDSKIFRLNGSSSIPYVAIKSIFHSEEPYEEIDIIQGERKSKRIPIESIRLHSTSSRLDPYLYIPVVILNCENASSPISRSFFKVYTIEKGERIEWRVVDTLLFSQETDLDVEVYNDLYSRNLFYLKFNNDSNRGRTLDLTEYTSLEAIDIEYIETMGESGNQTRETDEFRISNLNNGVNILYGISPSGISGGKNEESILDIKAHAPKFYNKNYTAGTKKAYEEAVKNLSISIPGIPGRIDPKNVVVFGKKDKNNQDIIKTAISFTATNLEDMLKIHKNLEKDLSKILSSSLSDLKSPTDDIIFVMPQYYQIALGVSYTPIEKVNREDQISQRIQEIIKDNWSSSGNLNFNKSFISSVEQKIISDTLENNSIPDIAVNIDDVEAIVKIDWDDLTLKTSKINKSKGKGGPKNFHTFRVPFKFDSLFESFKQEGYVLRVDFFFKRPIQMNQNTNPYNVSIFIGAPSVDDATENYFTVQQGSSEDGQCWDFIPNLNDRDDILEDYSMLKEGCKEISDKTQFYLSDANSVLSTEDYNKLINNEQIKKPTGTEEGIGEYLIYFHENKKGDAPTDPILTGWLELGFPSIFKVLSKFKKVDKILEEKLKGCPEANIKCGQADLEVINTFKDILKSYVEVYVSIRVGGDIKNKEDENINKIIFIDSEDSIFTNKTIIGSTVENLTNIKKDRNISVKEGK